MKDFENGVSSHAHSNTEDHQLQRSISKVERPQSLTGEALFVAVICSSQLLAQAGLALSIVAQHIIGRSLGIDDQPAQLRGSPLDTFSHRRAPSSLLQAALAMSLATSPFFVGGSVWVRLVVRSRQRRRLQRHQLLHFLPQPRHVLMS